MIFFCLLLQISKEWGLSAATKLGWWLYHEQNNKAENLSYYTVLFNMLILINAAHSQYKK